MNTVEENVTKLFARPKLVAKNRKKMKIFKNLWRAMCRLATLSAKPVVTGHFIARNDVIRKLMERENPK